MKILALETSTPRGSLAIWAGDDLVWERAFVAERGHSAQLFTLLEEAREQWAGVDKIAVGLGPGSFSGVRISIAAAIGLGLAWRAPLVGLSSAAALLVNEPHYLLIGDARRDTFYGTEVRDGECVSGPELFEAEAMEARVQATTLPIYSTEPITRFPQAQLAFPSASVLAKNAALERGILQRNALEPLYLRPPHITPPRPR